MIWSYQRTTSRGVSPADRRVSTIVETPEWKAERRIALPTAPFSPPPCVRERANPPLRSRFIQSNGRNVRSPGLKAPVSLGAWGHLMRESVLQNDKQRIASGWKRPRCDLPARRIGVPFEGYLWAPSPFSVADLAEKSRVVAPFPGGDVGAIREAVRSLLALAGAPLDQRDRYRARRWTLTCIQAKPSHRRSCRSPPHRGPACGDLRESISPATCRPCSTGRRVPNASGRP